MACGHSFWPYYLESDPVTISDLVVAGAELSAHCRDCGNWKTLHPGLMPERIRNRPVPSLDGVFRCSRCQGTNTTAMPVYKSQKRQSSAAGQGWIMPPAQ